MLGNRFYSVQYQSFAFTEVMVRSAVVEHRNLKVKFATQEPGQHVVMMVLLAGHEKRRAKMFFKSIRAIRHWCYIKWKKPTATYDLKFKILSAVINHKHP